MSRGASRTRLAFFSKSEWDMSALCALFLSSDFFGLSQEVLADLAGMRRPRSRKGETWVRVKVLR